jgi:hypothetical protein
MYFISYFTSTASGSGQHTLYRRSVLCLMSLVTFPADLQALVMLSLDQSHTRYISLL